MLNRFAVIGTARDELERHTKPPQAESGFHTSPHSRNACGDTSEAARFFYPPASIPTSSQTNVDTRGSPAAIQPPAVVARSAMSYRR
jgi:hypothetical protein